MLTVGYSIDTHNFLWEKHYGEPHIISPWRQHRVHLINRDGRIRCQPRGSKYRLHTWRSDLVTIPSFVNMCANCLGFLSSVDITPELRPVQCDICVTHENYASRRYTCQHCHDRLTAEDAEYAKYLIIGNSPAWLLAFFCDMEQTRFDEVISYLWDEHFNPGTPRTFRPVPRPAVPPLVSIA